MHTVMVLLFLARLGYENVLIVEIPAITLGHSLKPESVAAVCNPFSPVLAAWPDASEDAQ